jgi:transcriptional regulator
MLKEAKTTLQGKLAREIMYVPKQFSEPHPEVMHELIRAEPLATLITHNAAGVEANHIPFVLIDHPAPFGTLRGHVARLNPLWREHPKDANVLAIFHGPGSYITPSWYASKAETGKVVPTWNYVSVHAKGTLRIFDDAQWLRSHLEILTAHNEAAFAHPWAVTDAPRSFIDKMIESIIGIEIVITELTGKWKASQNRSSRDRASAIEGLRAHGHNKMADIVQSRGGDAG